MPRYFALDPHKVYIHGCEWAANEKEKHFRLPNTSADVIQFAGTLDQDCCVAIEMTGNAFQLYDWLSAHAGQVVVANPIELKRLGSGRHTDRVDAARMAKMLAIGSLPTVWVPPQPMREVRALLQYRTRLIRQRTAAVNQAKAALRRNSYVLPRDQDLLTWMRAHGQKLDLPAGEWTILASATRMVAVLNEEIAALESEIAGRGQQVDEVRRLMSITGVRLLAATMIWARLGDPFRFRGPKAVNRFAGLDPRVNNSGETDRRGKISKNGPADLRAILVQVAWQVARHDTGSLGDFFRRKRKQIGTKRAIVALARKVLVVAWRLLVTGETYRCTNTKTYTRKLNEIRTLAGRGGYPTNAVLEAVLQARPSPEHSLRGPLKAAAS